MNRRLERLEDSCYMPRTHYLLVQLALLGQIWELDTGRYFAAANTSASDRWNGRQALVGLQQDDVESNSI